MKKNFILIVLVLCVQLLSAQIRIGAAAPEISLPDTKDSIVNLSSFKGKIVLIDFWASWCVPCRRSNKEVSSLYNKYKGQGFEVFAVSLDDKVAAWKKAIKKDKINYLQVYDTKGIYSPVADTYGVNEIPSSFLLDKDGIVLAINLEGKALKEMIEALLQR